jgi:branched-chain amino acid transport system permease protein
MESSFMDLSGDQPGSLRETFTTTTDPNQSSANARRPAWLQPAPIVVILLAAAAIAWVLFFAEGSAAEDPKKLLVTLLDGLTLAGLYFVVASGFTLVFGLMRVVNMAHGTFFLLGGYIALQVQREIAGGGRSSALTSEQVDLFTGWVIPLVVATVIVATIGLIVQQLLLRWNQGDELRQALITIAISVILADQMVAIFGGIATDIAWPRQLDHQLTIPMLGVTYPTTRLFILAVAIVVGVGLWLWLNRTRMGAVIRAGVDDRPMVEALGINVQLVFGIAFFVGVALAAMDGVIGGSFSGLAPGVDGQWLLNSLVVVIIGGMGSLGGAAVGALLYGLVGALAVAYLPASATYYSIIVTFVLLIALLALKPNGLYGRAT